MTPTPFTNMAVSLSGGGYRATAFHLGTLSYLDSRSYGNQNLLKQVKVISTISGGTLTGVMYALHLSKGKSFADCFDKLYRLLQEDKLVDQALFKLNHPAQWKNKNKTRDTINAFAEVYNETFYDEATFADLFNGPDTHLTDAIFGASEFSYGIQFRFQKEGLFGNGYLNLPNDVFKKIRLADAAAASSCFPGGFEPMIMPNDFGNGPESKINKKWQDKYGSIGDGRAALMDGGIIDNQGIEGVKLAENRHEVDGIPFIGTYLISDVSSESMVPYDVPTLQHQSWKDWFTINRLNTIAVILATVIGIVLYLCNSPIVTIVSTVLLTLLITWLLFFFKVEHLVKTGLAKTLGKALPADMLKNLTVLRRTPVYILWYLIKFRISSVQVMVMDIFLRRIRSLQLTSLYSDSNWNYRLQSNNIYAIEKDDTLPERMQKVIYAANHMPTTLWFSAADKANHVLDDLIACGQFTTCYNLIRYLIDLQEDTSSARVWDQLTTIEQDALCALQTSMEADWLKFKADPYWLLGTSKDGDRTPDASSGHT